VITLGFRSRCVECGRVYPFSFLERTKSGEGWLCIHCLKKDTLPESYESMLVRAGSCFACNRPVNSTARFCYWCMKKAYPPTLMLLNGRDGLYNPATDSTEMYMDIADFELCGWFVREIKQSDTKNSVFFLEYYGKRRCARVRNYPYFTRDQQECVVPSCTQINPLSMVGMMGF